jgi:hypothetical protein
LSKPFSRRGGKSLTAGQNSILTLAGFHSIYGRAQ